MSLKEYDPRPNFWDLKADMINHWACFNKVGFKLFSYDRPTFPSLDGCRNLNYGYFSLVSFGINNLLTKNVLFWGYLQILVFILLVVSIYFSGKNIKKISIFLFALFSPGIFLLLISGNMDIQIICLLIISSIYLVNKKDKIALSLILIASLFKFYTTPILIIVLILVKQKRSKIYSAFSIIVACLVITLQMVINPFPPFPAGAQNKFGSGIFDNYLRKIGIQVSESQGEVLGFVLLALSFLAIVYFHQKFRQPSTQPTYLSKKEVVLSINFLFMAVASITCYLATLNVDYRLTFIALSGIALMQIPHIKVKFFSGFFPYIWLLSLWVAFPFFLLKKYIGVDLQPVGDIAMLWTISYLIFQVFSIFANVKLSFQNQTR